MSIRIISTGRALPSRFVENAALAEFLDTTDEWIVSKTGIKSRAVITNESLTDLSVAAAQAALDKAGFRADSIDYIIASTMQGDFITPSLACAVSARLGTSCPAYDLNAACAGFVYALDTAAAYIASGRAARVLIIAADAMSRQVDWSDRGVCVLFGDGAGAAVVETGEALLYMRLTASGDTAVMRNECGSGNSPFAPPKSPDFLRLAGQEVFKFAVGSVEREVPLALAALGLTPANIDYYLLHQANKRIIDSARKRLGEPEEKFPINIDKYGNTSSATIPILLDEMLEDGRIKKGNTLLMAAFGAGLVTGNCVIKWE